MKSKQIIILSDIHASLEAYYAITEYMNQNKIDVAINLGDFISNGPNTCEVFDKLIQDGRFINIKGYDEQQLYDEDGMQYGIGQEEWLIKRLGPNRMKILKELPSTREIIINGYKLLLCHHNGWTSLLQEHAHTKKYENKKYQLIAYGGSHLQELSYAKVIFNGSMLIDPGALKPNKERQGNFATISFEDKAPEIHFHTIIIKEDKIVHEVEDKNNKAVRYEGGLDNNTGIMIQEKGHELLQTSFLHINNKISKDNTVIYIADEVIDKIIQIGFDQCKYVCIGCWSQDHKAIKELLYHLKCRAIKKSEDAKQEWYIGEVSDSVRELLMHHRKTEEGKLKWFEISFQESINSNTVIYSIFHYGKEGFLRKLTRRDLYNMEEILRKYNIVYDLTE